LEDHAIEKTPKKAKTTPSQEEDTETLKKIELRKQKFQAEADSDTHEGLVGWSMAAVQSFLRGGRNIKATVEVWVNDILFGTTKYLTHSDKTLSVNKDLSDDLKKNYFLLHGGYTHDYKGDLQEYVIFRRKTGKVMFKVKNNPLVGMLMENLNAGETKKKKQKTSYGYTPSNTLKKTASGVSMAAQLMAGGGGCSRGGSGGMGGSRGQQQARRAATPQKNFNINFSEKSDWSDDNDDGVESPQQRRGPAKPRGKSLVTLRWKNPR
jgi:hypothetical protein